MGYLQTANLPCKKGVLCNQTMQLFPMTKLEKNVLT